MNLRQRLGGNRPGTPPAPNPLASQRAPEVEPDRYSAMKSRLHRELIAKIDLSQLEGMDDAERRSQVERVMRRLIIEGEIRLTRADEERLITELMHDTFDLGPITPLLLDEPPDSS